MSFSHSRRGGVAPWRSWDINSLMTTAKPRCRASRRLILEPLEERALLTCSVHPNYFVLNATTSAAISAADFVQTATSVAPLDSSSPTGLTPARIRGAYGIDSIAVGSVKGDGAGQTIAIVDAYDDPGLLNSSDPNFLKSDLHQFDVHFGLADPPSFRKIGQDGSTHLAPASGSSGGYPAFSANVLAVGGTTLSVSGNSYVNELSWGDSGGGQSTQEKEPAAQGTVQVSGWRQTPDVSFDADPNSGVPVYDSYDCGSKAPWVQVGGTSLSAPCWGGLIAITNQLRAAVGRSSLDRASLTLAKIYNLPAADFHDITCGNFRGWWPSPGYDMITGRGSPVANLLVPDLAVLPSSQGVVALAAKQYLVGSTATITLHDGDLSGSNTCLVTVTSALGDSENVTFTALGDGFFQGTITTSGNGSVARGDGVLQTTTGTNAIRVAYNDANAGTGNAAVATATAAAYVPLTILTASPTSPIAMNQSYRLALTAFGGVGADSWSFTGSLPAGLSLNSTTGVISGTPTVAGKYHLVVTVADAGSPQNTFSAPLDLTVGTLVTAVSTTASGNTYHVAGDSIPLTVSFTQAVTVVGTPQIALNAGSGATAYYVSGSGTSNLVFNYTVGAGQYAFDLDYTSTTALSAAGGSIRDSAGNTVALALPPTGLDGPATSKIIIGPLPTTGSLTAVATSGNKATLTARFLTNPVTSLTLTGTVKFIDATTRRQPLPR